jgi:hypothetical protein
MQYAITAGFLLAVVAGSFAAVEGAALLTLSR